MYVWFCSHVTIFITDVLPLSLINHHLFTFSLKDKILVFTSFDIFFVHFNRIKLPFNLVVCFSIFENYFCIWKPKKRGFFTKKLNLMQFFAIYIIFHENLIPQINKNCCYQQNKNRTKFIAKRRKKTKLEKIK